MKTYIIVVLLMPESPHQVNYLFYIFLKKKKKNATQCSLPSESSLTTTILEVGLALLNRWFFSRHFWRKRLDSG